MEKKEQQLREAAEKQFPYPKYYASNADKAITETMIDERRKFFILGIKSEAAKVYNSISSTEDTVIMPRELTAENGSKGLMTGEFFELHEVPNSEYCGCGNCDFCKAFPDTPEHVMISVPVTWSTIKDIYKKLVKYHSEQI